MFYKYEIYLIFCLIILINNQISTINFENACKNIYFTSKKDCTVAPWQDNKRCCYISYKVGEGREGECAFIENSRRALKEKKNEYESLGKEKVKIECSSSNLYLKWIIFSYFSIFNFF